MSNIELTEDCQGILFRVVLVKAVGKDEGWSLVHSLLDQEKQILDIAGMVAGII